MLTAVCPEETSNYFEVTVLWNIDFIWWKESEELICIK
jgi:hypothetical protein